jgi:hypothetical protein
MSIELLFLVSQTLLLAVLAAVFYFSHLERQKLLDRIMSRTYTEFVDNQKPEENDFSDGQENIIDLENAKEDVIKG